MKGTRLGERVEVTLDVKADGCPFCHEPLPRGWDMSWPQIIGLSFGFWRGYIWMPGGYVHRRCLDATADGMWGRD